MIEHWHWIILGALAIVSALQQFRIYQIHRESAQREELFQIVTENAADMIALVDVKGHRLYNSPAYTRILGYSSAELGETSSFEQIHVDDRFKVLEAAREARSTGVGKKLEYRVRHKDGTWRVLESAANTIRDAKGEVSKLVIVNRDITERKRAEEQLEHNSFHDALTGLPNRRLFLDRLQHLFLRSQRNPDYQYAVLFVDLDKFKVFNDTMNTAAGDKVLVEIGRRLSLCLRSDDTTARPGGSDDAVCRFGGDEFTVLLDAVTDPSNALRVAQRIQAAVAEPVFIDSREVRASASVGIALSTGVHERADDLLKDADVAMRRAKGLGGSRCELFDEAMHTRAVGRLRLETELRTAVEKRQFRIFYQPVVRLDTRRITGFEALLRWQHPVQGLISPTHFLEAAEDSGLLVSIGHWLIAEACKQLVAWQVNNPTLDPVQVTVNVSARQFADARLVSDIEAALRQTGVEPSLLQLEMTENVVAADPKLTLAVLSHLKHLGIGMVLDDFGSGHSSLSQLRQFPVDALKIARSLIGEMMADNCSADMVALMIALAHKMNLKVIAEGIENAKQLQRLRELACEFGQGYLFSKPVEAQAAEQLLREQPSQAGASGA